MKQITVGDFAEELDNWTFVLTRLNDDRSRQVCIKHNAYEGKYSVWFNDFENKKQNGTIFKADYEAINIANQFLKDDSLTIVVLARMYKMLADENGLLISDKKEAK